MNNLIYSSLVIISILSVLVPLIFSIIKYRTFNKQLNVLFVYLSVSFALDITSITVPLHPIIYFCFTLLEAFFISYIFWLELEKKIYRNIIGILFALFLVMAFSVLFYNKDLNQTDDISSTSEAIIIISLGIMYFFKIFSDLNIPKLTNYYYFWLNSAFLLYF